LIDGLFIAGTDTGVGKTIVATGLIALARKTGLCAVGYKPIETGCADINGELYPEDGAALVRASEDAIGLQECVALRFRLPAAPLRAAKMAGESVNPGQLINRFESLRTRYSPVIVEAAGGLMVPVTERYMMIDLAVDLGLPVILVARTRLGTINHTLLSLEALAARDLKIRAVILCGTMEDGGPEEEYTMEDLGPFAHDAPLFLLPHMPGMVCDEPVRIAETMVRQWGPAATEKILAK
jgi:dethiobiotin synthetase